MDLTPALKEEIWSLVPRDVDDRLLWAKSNFRGTSFPGDTSFAKSTFGSADELEPIDFLAARFQGMASFEDALFRSHALFGESTWEGFASFERATFQRASFILASFIDSASFEGALFHEVALFEEIRCPATIEFANARFSGKSAGFEKAEIGDLRMAPIYLVADGSDATLSLRGLRLGRGLSLHCYGEPGLSSGVDATDMHIGAPSTIFLRDCGVVLEDCDLRAGVVIGTADVDESPGAALGPPKDSDESLARVLSVGGTDLSGVTLGDVELSRCCFRRSTNVATLEFGGRAVFGRTERKGMLGGRQSLADDWRVQHDQSTRVPDELAVPSWVQSPYMSRVDAGSAETAYRGLRKALEDSKASPLASDFYYGEMEMRRRRLKDEAKRVNPTLHAADRVVLGLYRHISGYGLWAGRTAAILVVVIVLGAFGLMSFGYDVSDAGGGGEAKPVSTMNSHGGQDGAGADQEKDHGAGHGSGGKKKAHGQGRTAEDQPPETRSPDFATALRTLSGIKQPPATAPTNVLGTIIAILARLSAGILIALTALAIRRRVKR